MSTETGKVRHFVERLLPPTIRLSSEQKRLDRHYESLIKEARKSGDGEQVRRLRAEWRDVGRGPHEEREYLVTERHLRKANRLRVRTPRLFEGEELSDDWEQGRSTGYLYLTVEGTEKVRKATRAEEAWRLEKRKYWIAWIAALTGLIGALIGLVLVLR